MSHSGVPPLNETPKQHDRRIQKLKKEELEKAHNARKARGSPTTTIKRGGVVPCSKAKAAIEVTIRSTNPVAREVGKATITFAANGGSLARPAENTAYLPLSGPATVTVTAVLVRPDPKYFTPPSTLSPIAVPAGDLTKATIMFTPLVRPLVKLQDENGGATVPGVGIKVGTNDLGDTQPDGIAQLPDVHGGILPTTYPVTFTFKPQPKRYEVLDDRQIDTATPSLYSLHKFTVRKLAWPKVKVIVDGSMPEQVVQGVQVKLGTYDLGLTGGKGIAAQTKEEAGVKEGTYPVALILKGRGLETYVPVDDNATFDVARGSEDTYTVKVKAASLVVIVRRADGKPVAGTVQFDLAGPTPLTDQALAACTDPDDKRIEKKVKDALTPGDYTVTIKNVAAVQTAQKKPLSSEKWRIGPDKTGKLKVKVVAGKTETVEFTLTKYNKIQFIAFNIKPGTYEDTITHIKHYLGDPDPVADLDKRCAIMTKAMDVASKHGDVDPNDYVLKVFMAPEFYFRGAAGGYELQNIHEILGKLKAEAQKHEDWLFVYGTAIGYQKHEDEPDKGTGKSSEYELKISSSSAAAVTTVRVTNDKDKASACARIPSGADPLLRWGLQQGVLNAKVVKKTKITDDEYDLELDAILAVTNTACKLLETVATEVYNVALVQKGGSADGSSGLREAAIYKEYVSHIDFITPSDYDTFHDPSGKGRKIDIHGDVTRTVLPTTGSVDPLGGTPNLGSEVNKSGVGGGGVFMVDGITFGLEICRDHCLNRLGLYYKDRASGGDPKVQVSLIPSWGAQIKDGAIPAIKNALVFNVDGPKGSAAAVLNEAQGKCSVHGTLHPVPGECPQVDVYYCDRGPHAVTGDPCPTCGKPARADVDYHLCIKLHLYAHGVAQCPHCNTGLKPYFRCDVPHRYTAGAKCADCNAPLQGVAPNLFCPKPHFSSTGGIACACGQPWVEVTCCDVDHQFPLTDTDCPDCGSALTNHVRQWYCDEKFHTSAVQGTGNCPIPSCAQPWKEYHETLKQKWTLFSAQPTVTTVADSAGSPVRLFETTGDITVYPVKDVPEAESIP